MIGDRVSKTFIHRVVELVEIPNNKFQITIQETSK